MQKRLCNNKILIYLDQFAVSGMIEAKEGSIWHRIKLRLQKLYSEGLLFCPLSTEHAMETSLKRYESAAIHESFFKSISDGFTFLDIASIITGQINDLVKNKGKLCTPFLSYPKWDLSDKQNHENISQAFGKNKKDELHMFEKFKNDDLSVLVRDRITHADKEHKCKFLDFFESVEVNKFKKKTKWLIDNYDFFKCRKDRDLLELDLDKLLFDFDFTISDFENLIIQIENSNFNNIPTLNIKTKLSFIPIINSCSLVYNDFIDINRIAIGLPYSDYLFCDKKHKTNILNLGLDKLYGTNVFSGEPSDLKEFLDLLK